MKRLLTPHFICLLLAIVSLGMAIYFKHTNISVQLYSKNTFSLGYVWSIMLVMFLLFSLNFGFMSWVNKKDYRWLTWTQIFIHIIALYLLLITPSINDFDQDGQSLIFWIFIVLTFLACFIHLLNFIFSLIKKNK